MAFHKSNNSSFAKQRFSPTDHLHGFHLHINWKLLGVKKIFVCLKLQLFPSTGKVQRALFPQPSPPRRNHKLAADLEHWKSGAFGWYQLDQGRSTYSFALEEQCVCFCVAKDYLPWNFQQSLLSASCGWRNILYCFCQVNIFNAPQTDADDFLQACEPWNT